MKKEIKTIRIFCTRSIYDRIEGKKDFFTKTVKVKDIFAVYGEDFAIHRSILGKEWEVSHVGTGYRAGYGRTAEAAKVFVERLLRCHGEKKVLLSTALVRKQIIDQKDNTDHEE